ncbi:MAG: nucleotidyltransferase domain-containing protein [Desulfobacteraceae bacterium]|jgi:predicted nucleotidyltransferase
MDDVIVKALHCIEKDHNVKTILACESGSRAWGFPSDDSDYDVRFIFVNQKDWYLSIADKRDVIELPVDDLLDVNGWDLKKALHLMRKSNSPLLEWLSSPIQYHVWPEAFNRLFKLSKMAFMPETSCYHYLSMAKKKVEQFKENERVKLKTYMYAIRSTLCCEWIIKNMEQPPMHIDNLLAEITDDLQFKDQVNRLIAQKKAHTEKFTVERSEVIENYINQKIIELQDNIPDNPSKLGMDLFDDVFRSILEDSNK